MREILLVARREYLAYIGAWGFWASLVSTPLIMLVIAFAPILLRQAEPVRVVAILADDARDRAALEGALTTAPEVVFTQSRGAGGLSRAAVAPAPGADIEALRPYLTGEAAVIHEGEARPLFAAFVVRRQGEAVRMEYWSANLSDRSLESRARRALAEAMRAEALTARGVPSAEVVALQALEPEVIQFDPRVADGAAGPAAVTVADRAPFVAGLILSFVLWGSVLSVANMLLTSVLEEKSNKILDSLLTSVAPVQILAGKLLGVAMVSATLFGFWGLVGSGAVSAAAGMAPQSSMTALVQAALSPGLLATLAGCFLGGYLIYGALFLALGALCESLQEAQTLLSPLILVMVVPMIVSLPAFENPNAPLIVALSWVPVFTPFLTMMRAPAGLPLWEIVGLMVMMAAFAALVLALSARVFRGGVSGEASLSTLKHKLFGAKTAPHPTVAPGA